MPCARRATRRASARACVRLLLGGVGWGAGAGHGSGRGQAAAGRGEWGGVVVADGVEELPNEVGGHTGASGRHNANTNMAVIKPS